MKCNITIAKRALCYRTPKSRYNLPYSIMESIISYMDDITKIKFWYITRWPILKPLSYVVDKYYARRDLRVPALLYIREKLIGAPTTRILVQICIFENRILESNYKYVQDQLRKRSMSIELIHDIPDVVQILSRNMSFNDLRSILKLAGDVARLPHIEK